MRRANRTFAVLAGVVLATGSLAACGSDEEPAASSPGETVTVMGIDFPKPEKTDIKFGISAISVGDLPGYLIGDLKLGEQFGLNVEVMQFNGDAPTRQALTAGQIDVADVSGGVAVASRRTGRPSQIVFNSQDKLSDLLIGGRDVADANSLRGKSVAVSSFGSQSYAGALLSLKALGLTKDDVTITAVGNDAARLAALRAGGVGAAILDADEREELTKLGFHVLTDLGTLDVAGYTTTSLTVPEEFQEKYPNTTLALVAAFQMGRWMAYSDVPTAAKTWAKTTDVSIERATEEINIRNEVQRPLDGRCRDDVMDFVKEVLIGTDPSLESVDPRQACTTKWVDKLKEMGWQKKLGVPGY
jgi:NitT/TauT family transport system substrate-binding protein